MAKAALKSFQMFGASGVSLATDQISEITTVTRMDNVEILLSWTGTTPVGSLAVQVCHDISIPVPIWVPLDFGTTIAITGDADTANIEINQIPAPFIRCVYTASSGTGTLLASIAAKSLSGGAA